MRSKSWTLGLRYELEVGVAVKLEAQRFYDMSNDKIMTNGLFTPQGSAPSIEEEEPTVFRLTVDVLPRVIIRRHAGDSGGVFAIGADGSS